jgi:peptidoglycan/xylan/chitin deacetylase (PgdA/CDA1 family)
VSAHSTKLALARALDRAGVNAAGHRLQLGACMPFVRAVNYHDVPPSLAAAFEAQLRFYAERFEPVGRDGLLALWRGEWRTRRPGLILSFDDGLRSHAEVAAPLLERYGFTGWFFVPAGLLDTPAADQRAVAERVTIRAADEYGDGRIFMTVDQMRSLARRHVVGCHTASHVRLTAGLDRPALEREIAGAKRLMERQLGTAVDAFCWVGGEEWSYSRAAAEEVRRAGFRLSFMTNSAPIRPATNLLQLQRTNVEAADPPWLVRFQLSGFMDVLYAPKRRRVNRLTS